MKFSMGRRETEQVASHLGKDALSALDIRGREDLSDKGKIGQLIVPALNKRQHMCGAVFRFNRGGSNPEVMCYKNEIGRSHPSRNYNAS